MVVGRAVVARDLIWFGLVQVYNCLRHSAVRAALRGYLYLDKNGNPTGV